MCFQAGLLICDQPAEMLAMTLVSSPVWKNSSLGASKHIIQRPVMMERKVLVGSLELNPIKSTSRPKVGMKRFQLNCILHNWIIRKDLEASSGLKLTRLINRRKVGMNRARRNFIHLKSTTRKDLEANSG